MKAAVGYTFQPKLKILASCLIVVAGDHLLRLPSSFHSHIFLFANSSACRSVGPHSVSVLTPAPNLNFCFRAKEQPESSILTGRFMLQLGESSGDRGTHQGAGSEILIAPAQPCREPCEQFCISDCVTLCIGLLL